MVVGNITGSILCWHVLDKKHGVSTGFNNHISIMSYEVSYFSNEVSCVLL